MCEPPKQPNYPRTDRGAKGELASTRGEDFFRGRYYLRWFMPWWFESWLWWFILRLGWSVVSIQYPASGPRELVIRSFCAEHAILAENTVIFQKFRRSVVRLGGSVFVDVICAQAFLRKHLQRAPRLIFTTYSRLDYYNDLRVSKVYNLGRKKVFSGLLSKDVELVMLAEGKSEVRVIYSRINFSAS